MGRRHNLLSPYQIDRDWPHQVGLPDDLCTDRSFTIINAYCAEHRLDHKVRKVQAIWPGGKYEEWRLHCFADPAKADAFHTHFGGVRFDPSRDREKGKTLGVWRREGRYERILDLGPLSVPAILRN